MPIGIATRNGMRQAKAPQPPPSIAAWVSHGDMAKATRVPVSRARKDAIWA